MNKKEDGEKKVASDHPYVKKPLMEAINNESVSGSDSESEVLSISNHG